MTEELKPCPFCGEVPDLPSGDGTQYEIECGNCSMAMASVQICDLMTYEERSAEKFTNYRYSEQYVERAKAEAITQWNTRATLSPAHIEDEREACGRWIRQQIEMPAHIPMDWDVPCNRYTWAGWSARAALDATPAAGTTSDQYRAELYDEVWQKARDMGYGNVTDALVELERIKAAPPAAGVPEGISIERDMMGTMHIKLGDFDYVQVRYQHPYTDNASTRQLAERIAALIAAPTLFASEQQRAVVMPERKAPFEGADGPPDWRPLKNAEVSGWNACVAEFLRLNPHLAKGEGV